MEDVSVLEMAKSRENRRGYQQKLLKKYSLPLISFTLNIPGPQKDLPRFRSIHREGVLQINERFKSTIVKQYVENLRTGSEAYFVINQQELNIKNICTTIEDLHPLGRIFDIDVLNIWGESLSRNLVGLDSRKCLICNERASICSRSRKHEIIELIDKIFKLSDYLDK